MLAGLGTTFVENEDSSVQCAAAAAERPHVAGENGSATRHLTGKVSQRKDFVADARYEDEGSVLQCVAATL